ncbi:hypothetical protein Leryth_002424 [Lithospermum erythrorhizon]|nr:hypothetical protein Leryth_002424 [Lithospermum erythrorhizon]
MVMMLNWTTLFEAQNVAAAAKLYKKANEILGHLHQWTKRQARFYCIEPGLKHRRPKSRPKKQSKAETYAKFH